ncbi:MAG TPA: DNA mismatch repair protein MutS, partial [Nannocystis exedens]|nr:DNA mismatch repair protein MutS [Nannocystis exedens]
MPDPRAEYSRLRQLRNETVLALKARSHRFSNLRVLVFVAFVACLCAGFAEFVPLPWSLLPALIFVAIAIAHESLERTRARALLAVQFYERALRRIDGRWQEDGPSGEEFVPKNHIYAADLDLFGNASLFTLLCTARTGG